MNVLVVGAAGFIGTHLVKALDRNRHNVTAIDLPDQIQKIDQTRAKAFAWDIRERKNNLPDRFGAEGFSCLVHLAAIASPRECEHDPQKASLTNVHGTENVLLLSEKYEIPRVVFFSSAHVYGISPKYLPTDEVHPLSLHDTYTTSKILGEKLCELTHANRGIDYCALRLFNAYGHGQSEKYFIGVKLKEARIGDFMLSDPDVTKDWVWIDDVIDAAVRAVESPYVGALNIGTGVEGSLRDIASKFATAWGRVVMDDKRSSGGPTRMCADSSRAKRVLGWWPRVSLNEGLNRLIKEAKER